MGVRHLPSPLNRSVVTIGNFDGVHRGHRELISQVAKEAQNRGVVSVVLTFHPHPIQVLFPEKGLKRLFDLTDLQEQVADLGIDYLIIEPFSREFSQLPPEKFIQDWLYQPLCPEVVVVGYDFSFGANRSGSIDVLKKSGERLGFSVQAIEPVSLEGQVASSSRIRQAVAQGQMREACQMLGRPFSVRGVVEKGDGRGRKLGFPTANLRMFSETYPKSGVYATCVTLNGKSYPSVTNVGQNPTFKQEGALAPLRVETHLLDVSLDLYGEEFTLEFISYLREEKRFANIEDLKAQIQRDVNKARETLSQKANL